MRHALDHLDAALPERRDLLGIVGQKPHLGETQLLSIAAAGR